MQAGDPQPAFRRSTSSNSLDVYESHDSCAINGADGRSSRPRDSANASPKNGELDQEQLLSACLLEDHDSSSSPLSPGSQLFPYATAPSPIPASVSQTEEVDLSSSPAALFLSAFMSPKPEPASLPDDEGFQVGGYTLGSIVGFGSFSTIRKAVSTSGGNVVAIKIIRRADLVRTGHAPLERKKLEHEATIWASLSHEHILPLFSAVHTEYADYFITLYCPAGSLYDILKRDGSPALPQDDAGMMFRQVVRGLRYLHEDALLVHRDMKLENVLVDESGVCRIGDFGMSVKIGQVLTDEEALWEDEQYQQQDAGYNTVHRAFSLSVPKRPGRIASTLNPISRHHSARQRSTTSSQASHARQPGSLPYAAPENLLPQSPENTLPHPSQDIWALGVMLYALLAGRLPFNDSFEPRLQMKILNGVFDIPEDIGRGAERILHGCLERSVPKRWSIAMVDEVAWGVGWGSAGDTATQEEEEDHHVAKTSPNPEPYQNLADTIISDEEDWQQEERIPRSAMEAATRRSTSRVKRSISRAPIQIRTQSGRSISRASRATSPTSPHSSLSPVFFRRSEVDSGSGSTSHSPVRSPFYESPPRSRSASRPRGRKPNKSYSYFPSRSPSPSVVPTTPVDLGSHILARMHLEDHPEELELDPAPRGRSLFAPSYQDQDDGYGKEEDDSNKQGSHLSPHNIESIASRWASVFPSYLQEDGSRSISSDASSRDRSCDMDASNRRTSTIESDDCPSLSRRSRPGSTPHGSSSESWGALRTKGIQEGILMSRSQSQEMFLGTTLNGSPATPGLISRSRSAEDP